MTTVNKTSLTRKVTLALGAIIVSTMSIAGANQAQAKVHVDLHFGGWGGPSYINPGFNNCNKYWWKYKNTGNFWYKKKYMKCMGYW